MRPGTKSARPVRLLCAALILLFCMPPAFAHPHIFARYHVAIGPSEKGYIRLHFTFTFQNILNPILTPGSPADRPLLTNDVLANLADHPFFVYLEMDGQNIGRQIVYPVPDVSKDQIYSFDLTIPDTVKNFAFALYDPGYFVAVALDGPAALTTASLPMPCAVEERTVAATVWGNVRAQYIVCGHTAPPISSPKSFDHEPDNRSSDMGDRIIP